jgi:8-oxo-dGTP pyrophosphatase MutT (NUDIX family)
MDRILRAAAGWQELLADALARTPRPIAVDRRFTPRPAAEPAEFRRYDRSSAPAARPASTLLAVYPGADGELTVPLTLRRDELPAHPGEVSLPGGAADPSDASREATALREAHEEVGLLPGQIRIIGALDDIWIPVSNFDLRPFVAVADATPTLRPHAPEVAAIVELPLRLVVEETILGEEEIPVRDFVLHAGAYRYAGLRIWGATARTLAMLATVLRTADTDDGQR